MAHLRRRLGGSPPAVSAVAWPAEAKKPQTAPTTRRQQPEAVGRCAPPRSPSQTSAPVGGRRRCPPIDRRLRFARTHQPDPRSSVHVPRRREKPARACALRSACPRLFSHAREEPGRTGAECAPRLRLAGLDTAPGFCFARASEHHQPRSRRTMRLTSHGARALGHRPGQAATSHRHSLRARGRGHTGARVLNHDASIAWQLLIGSRAIHAPACTRVGVADA
jgi:hypothetical protein